MSAAISYAHAASAATKPSPSNGSADSLVKSQTSISTDAEKKPATKAETKSDNSNEVENDESRTSSVNSTSSASTSKAAPSSSHKNISKKVKLAPAPLPTKNAWGNTPKVATSTSSTIAETILSAEKASNESSSHVLKAPSGKEKWIPFKASVVIASPRSNNGSGKRKGKKRSSQEKRNGSRRQSQHNQLSKDIPRKEKSTDAKDKSENKKQQKQQQVPESNPGAESEVIGADTKSVHQSQQSQDKASQDQAQKAPKKHAHNGTASTAGNNNGNYGGYHQRYQNGYQYGANNNVHGYGRSYGKHNNGQANGYGNYQQGQYGQHNGSNRRYSNGMPYVPYNRYYMPMMYMNMNGKQNAGKNSTEPAKKGSKSSEEDGKNDTEATDNKNQQQQHHHHGHKSNLGQPYMFQPFYPPMGYMMYGQRYGNAIPGQQQQQQGSYGNPSTKSARDMQLESLANQIDYYFSTQNLIKDIYLRKNMNDEGFLPLPIVAAFYRVAAMSFNDEDTVIESLEKCKNLEYGYIEGANGKKTYKLRPIKDPKQWVLSEDQRVAAGKDQSVPKIQKKKATDKKEEKSVKNVKTEKTEATVNDDKDSKH